MNKKQFIKKTAAMVLGLTVALSATGCDFFTKDSKKDLNQTIATVNLIPSMESEVDQNGNKVFSADAIAALKSLKISGSIKKRELVSYYLSIGYNYHDNYGYSYEDTFNMLLNALLNREKLVQYAAAYFLNNEDFATSYANYKAAFPNESDEVLSFRYLLSKGNTEDNEDFNVVTYTMRKNINDAIDSIESSKYISSEDKHSHGTPRTMPTGVNTEKEDYYPQTEAGAVNYDIYTGRNGASACGEYKKQDGSTSLSRQKAYNAYLTNLQNYGLIGDEDTSDVKTLKYYEVELISLLEQRLVNKYYEAVEGTIHEEIDGTYVNQRYQELYNKNKLSYAGNPTAFASAMDSASATNFLTYAENYSYGSESLTFGYVYNILIPFSEEQEIAYEEAKAKGLDDNALYAERNNIAKNIKGEDLRSSWISMDEHVNYSYMVGDDYYFFEDNNENGTRYEALAQYAGNYPFQGDVTVSDDGDEYEFDTKKYALDIDAFMGVFEAQIKAAAGENVQVSGSAVNGYYDNTEFETGKGDDKEVDYSKFTYYTGKVTFSEEQTAAGFFDPTTEQYKALSAVNELMFAYSTDTGCLNTFMGYSVTPYKTNFVPEFEVAAQQVVKDGVGSYAVCLTDYGWHIIYCSFSYTEGYVGADNNAYGVYDHTQKDVEGNFSNLFYEYVKDSAYSGFSTELQTKTLKKYDGVEKLYKGRYKDLYDFDNY